MIFFQKMNELRAVPSRVPKFNRETEIARQSAEKLAQNRACHPLVQRTAEAE